MTNKQAPLSAVSLETCQTTDFAKLSPRSEGKALFENSSEKKFLIHEYWSREGCAEALRDWPPPPPDANKNAALEKIFAEAGEKLLACDSREQFCEELDSFLRQFFIEQKDNLRLPAYRGRVIELMVSLWARDCVVWPKKHDILGKVFLPAESTFWGAASEIIAALRPKLESSSQTVSQARVRALMKLMLGRSAIQSIVDICPGSAPLELPKMDYNIFAHMAKTLIGEQRRAAPDAKPYELSEFALSAERRVIRAEPELNWVAAAGPRLAIWREEAVAYLKTVAHTREQHFMAVNAWLDYVIATLEIPKNPVEYFDRALSRSYPAFDSAGPHRTRIFKKIKAFLHFVLLKHCAQPDDFGSPVIPGRFGIPLAASGETKPVNEYETRREPMPMRFVSLCAQILTERDFAWAKELKKDQASPDWIKWKNPETNEIEDVWSPVRCYVLLLKLLLPARTYQLRVLDSGEADSEAYDCATGKWRENTGRLAPTRGAPGRRQAPVEKGVFRKFVRKDGSTGSLMYFNTNKTSDIDQPSNRRGYVMPWEHKEALGVFANLRKWQEKYNPLHKPTPWSEVRERRLRGAAELDKMGSACFLFRDPTVKDNPTLPISNAKINALWMHLMAELERRLAALGERLPDGSPIRLIKKDEKTGRPASAAFDLHSLRVTMITALYENGAPAEYIMKIAGHASVLMTLHYVKLSGEDITFTLNEALVRRGQNAQSEWIGFLQKRSHAELKKLTSYNHESGIDELAAASGASVVVMDHGFCPMAQRRCQDGLANEEGGLGNLSFNPVPGGPTNCVRCRFFISGPAFLVGLEAHFNALSYRAKLNAEKYQLAQARLDELINLRAIALEESKPFDKGRELQNAEPALERATAEANETVLSMHAAYRLIEQCLAIAEEKREQPSPSLSLVVDRNGGETIRAMLEETHSFEQLHRICETAELFESLPVDSRLPNLERMRCYDRMLSEAGLPPAFCLINDDQVALRVANEMGRFLYARLKKSEVSDLADGRLTLEALGFKSEFLSEFQRVNKIAASGPSAANRVAAGPRPLLLGWEAK